MSTVSLLEELKKNIEIVVKQNKAFKQNMEWLEAKNKELQKIINEQNNSLNKKDELIKALECAKMLKDNNDSHSGNEDLKNKINEMVREIDKCIAYLDK